MQICLRTRTAIHPKKHFCKQTDERNAKWEIARQKPAEAIENLTLNAIQPLTDLNCALNNLLYHLI